MDFIDRITELAARIPKQLEHIQTEEATKNALIMPFISALGYNVFDPTEVTPELNADIGLKKGEKVDYAILQDGQPIILFECKNHSANLDKAHASQLYRYFSVTQARFAVLTNGIIYRFFTDLEAKNRMDSKPFFEFNILDFKERQIDELKKFTKTAFDLENIISTASELKYTRAIKRVVAKELEDPSEEFVKFVASQVYDGRFTKAVKEQFSDLTKKAIQQYINERINKRLESALAEETAVDEAKIEEAETPVEEEKPKVITTDEELEGYYIVKSILRDVVDPSRIVMRDVQSYCGILLDDNNRKPLCRLRFNGSTKYLCLIDSEKQEDCVPIDALDEIFKHAERLKQTPTFYD